MKPPAMCASKPSSHRTTSIAIIVYNILYASLSYKVTVIKMTIYDDRSLNLCVILQS